MTPTPDPPDIPGLQHVRHLHTSQMSTVYKAHQKEFSRWVALKVLHVDGEDERVQQAFRDECQIMGRLSNQRHIVTPYECGVAPDGRPYLISEFCEGGSLADLLSEHGSLPPEQVHEYALQLADALAVGHRARVWHRDVKPENILLTAYGDVALTDFGLSVRQENRSRALDAYTPEHAAPEVLGDGAMSEAADLYSLGSTLFTLLTGSPPFPLRPGEGDAPRLLRIKKGDPGSLSDVPSPLREVVLRLLAKDPSGRPSSADEVRRLLMTPPAAEAGPARGQGDTRPTSEPPTGGDWAPLAGGGAERRGRDGERSVARGSPATGTIHRPGERRTQPPPDPDRKPAEGGPWSPKRVVLLLLTSFLIVALAAYLLRRGLTDESGPAIALSAPVVNGGSVSLNWTGPQDLTYAVFYDGVDTELQIRPVGSGTAVNLELEPGRAYCIEVRGSDGVDNYRSNRVSVGGAVCE